MLEFVYKYHIVKSAFMNIMQYVLTNTTLKKCPSEYGISMII